MSQSPTADTPEKQVVIFDLDKTTLDPFVEVRMQIERIWNSVVKPTLEECKLGKKTRLKDEFPDFPFSFHKDDLEVKSQFGRKRLLLHRIYPVIRNYKEAQQRYAATYEQLVLSEETEPEDLEKQKQLSEALDKERNTMDQCAGVARSVFSEIIQNKFKSYEGMKKFPYTKRHAAQERVNQRLRDFPHADGHHIIHEMNEVKLDEHQFLPGMDEVLARFSDPEKYIIAIVTNRIPPDPENLNSLFGPKGTLPENVSPDLVFTQQDGDKSLHTREDEKNPKKGQPRAGIPTLVEKVKAAFEKKGITDNMIKNAVHTGDLHDDFAFAKELGCNFVRVTHGQDVFFKPILEEKCAPFVEFFEKEGRSYRVANNSEELLEAYLETGILPNPRNRIANFPSSTERSP